MVGLCFICGDIGHLKKTSMKAAHGQERWYSGNRVMDGMTKGSVDFVSSKCNSQEVHVRCSSACAVKEYGECR